VAAAAAGFSEQLAAGGKPPLTILKPAKLGAEAREEAAALQGDLLVSFAYGRIFGPKFLSLFPLGGINIHPSLLPRYRGAAPIPAAILNRDTETGVSIQKLAAEMDSGDILAQESFPLSGRETTGSLSGIAAQKAAEMLPAVLRLFKDGAPSGTVQNHGEAVYCSLIAKEDGIIDWSAPALRIDARVRAFNPWPLCQTRHNGEILYILEAAPAIDAGLSDGGLPNAGLPAAGLPAAGLSGAASLPDAASAEPGTVLGIDKRQGILVQTGDGVLAVTALQYQARKALDWRAFVNGVRNFAGSRLG
jgi:methionyl-tRNA formyltransferase